MKLETVSTIGGRGHFSEVECEVGLSSVNRLRAFGATRLHNSQARVRNSV